MSKTLVSYFRDFSTIAQFAFRHPGKLTRLLKIRDSHLTYLDLAALVDLHKAVAEIEQRQIPGVIIEAGCALGGSALAITSAKHLSRKLIIYDTFQMIPPPSDLDGKDAHSRYREIIHGESKGLGNNLYYGYQGDLVEQIRKTFLKFGYPLESYQVELVKGLFQDQLHPTEPIALAHLDCDWYESVLVCLNRIVPHMVDGGVLVLDDYEHWSGAKQAVDEYFTPQRRQDFRFIQRSRLYIQKCAKMDDNSTTVNQN